MRPMPTLELEVGSAILRFGPAGQPLTTSAVNVEERSVRRRSGLRAVAADPSAAAGGAVQYWMWNGVAEAERVAELSRRAIRFELTSMADRPLGDERPKTSGHLHVRPALGRPIYPEVCQVLAGTAGFLVQDLGPGPSASYAALVVVGPGEWVILPPGLHHGTVNLAGDPLVFADVIARRATAGYAGLAAAHGFAHYILADGSTIPNPAYRDVPSLERITALEWSGLGSGAIYDTFVGDSEAFPWLQEPEMFATAFPDLAERIRPVLGRMGEPL